MSGALARALIEACRCFDSAPALSWPSGDTSYRSLAQRGRQLESCLRHAGVQPDEPVHVPVSNEPRDVAALLGTWLAGAVAVPIHRATPPAVMAAFQQRSMARFALDPDPDITGSCRVARLAEHAPPARSLLAQAALIVFTSGSTGRPKGVVLSHEAFLRKLECIDERLRFGSHQRTLLVLNLTFSFGLWVTLLTLLRGGVVRMHPKFEPDAFLAALADDGIVRVGMVPTMMRVLLADARASDAIARATRSRSLRQILIGGESLGLSLAKSIRRHFDSADLIDIYGLTETSTCDFFAFPDDFSRYPGCIGRPAPGIAFRIADGQGRAVSPGAVGELQLRTPYLMAGYLDDPGLTDAAMQDGWFRTGDLACTVADDVVRLMGRSKELIVRGGNKITPFEIEQATCAHPDVAAAMAVGVADEVLGQRIHLLLVPRAGIELDLSAVRAHLRERLERFKQPDFVYLAAALPLGRTGKSDANAFRGLIESGAIRPVPTEDSLGSR